MLRLATSLLRRTHRFNELEQLQKHPIGGVEAAPRGDDVFHWVIDVQGPANTPYEDAIFVINLDFPPEFPTKPPKMKFVTKIYHPNVNENGEACLHLLLEDHWQPKTTVIQVLHELLKIMQSPNLDEPLQAEIAHQFMYDRNTFNEVAAAWAKKYAGAREASARNAAAASTATAPSPSTTAQASTAAPASMSYAQAAAARPAPEPH